MNFLQSFLSSAQSRPNPADGYVGIDIGSSSIKVVEIQDRKGVLTLTTYGEVQLGPYVNKPLGDAVSLDQNREQEALVDVIRESAVKTRNAVFAMPLSSSFVTNISLDADADANLAAMVRVEARKVIPASLSEVTLDWAEVEVTKAQAEQSSESRRDVLVAAIQNNALERFKILMQFAGLKQPPTEIECFSTIRSLFSHTDENIAIVDIGASSTKLYIVRKGLLMRMHRIRAGGAVVTKKIAEVLSVPFEEAEQIKCTTQKNDASYSDVKRTHDVAYDRAFREFKQVINEYETKTGITVDSVYLSGGGALFPGVETLLKNALEKNIVLANPFSKVAYPAFMEDVMEKIGPSFTVALGAAMRAIE